MGRREEGNRERTNLKMSPPSQPAKKKGAKGSDGSVDRGRSEPSRTEREEQDWPANVDTRRP